MDREEVTQRFILKLKSRLKRDEAESIMVLFSLDLQEQAELLEQEEAMENEGGVTT